MKAYRIAILYRYLLENTCKGHTVNADNIVEHYENAGNPYEIKAVKTMKKDDLLTKAVGMGLEVTDDDTVDTLKEKIVAELSK